MVVEKDSTHTRTIDVIRDNEKSSIEFRSLRVQVIDRSGKTRKFIAKMPYDGLALACSFSLFLLTRLARRVGTTSLWLTQPNANYNQSTP